MAKRLTIRDLAGQLGVHYSTVSLALRNDPSLPVRTREKIQAAAQRLGYQPNAAAQALSIHRRRVSPPSEYGVLALLGPKMVQPIYMEGAIQRAGELGYRMEIISWPDPKMTGRQLARILRARGVRGILIAGPSFPGQAARRANLDYSHLSAVRLGHGLVWPRLHNVSDNQFRNTRLAVRKLLSLGYRRIGLCLNARAANLPDSGWRGGYFAEMERLKEWPSPFYCRNEPLNSEDDTALRNWIQRERLEALITYTDDIAIRAGHLSGRPVPKEFGVVSLACEGEFISGIRVPFNRIGAAGVDYLVHLIQTDQRGIPEFPQRLLLDGTWFAGRTVRRLAG